MLGYPLITINSQTNFTHLSSYVTRFSSFLVIIWLKKAMVRNMCREYVIDNCRMNLFFILSFFVGCILSFGLVRLRTIRLVHVQGHTLGAMFTLMRGGCDNHRCHNKNPRWEMRLGCEWRHVRKRWAGILGDFEKKQELMADAGRCDLLFDLGEASPVGSTGCAAHCWVSWNSYHIKNCVSLSLCCKHKSQESSKRFVPELKRVVSVSRISGFLCIWTFLQICIFV